MAELIASRSVTLNSQNPRLQSPTVNLDRLTSAITVKLRRPTTAQPLNWNANSTVRVSLVFIVDGVEYRCVGHVTGGFRYADPPLNTIAIPEYRLTYSPTVLFVDKAREYIKTATPDKDGFYENVPLTRLGETGSIIQGYLLLERVRGTINTVITIAATTEAPAPTVRTKNSVAFDAASTVYEGGGDGVVSVSHISGGSDRGVFAASGIVDFFEDPRNPATSSITYGGSGMTEQWDLQIATVYGVSGYTLLNPATGAQTVTATAASGGPTDMALGVISFTGVGSVGTAATQTGNSSTASVTVSGVESDGMVVDSFINESLGVSSVGADQTQRNNLDGSFATARSSTQPGTAGGVMSWNFPSSGAWGIGAIEFKPVASQRPPLTRWHRQAVVRAAHY